MVTASSLVICLIYGQNVMGRLMIAERHCSSRAVLALQGLYQFAVRKVRDYGQKVPKEQVLSERGHLYTTTVFNPLLHLERDWASAAFPCPQRIALLLGMWPILHLLGHCL